LENTENERLKSFRKYLKKKQGEFSESLGLKQGSYSPIESGKGGISYQLLKSLVSTYNLNPTWLVTGQGSMQLDTKVKVSPNTEHDLDNIIKGIPKAPEDQAPYGNVQLVPVIVNDDAKQNAFFVPQVAYASYVEKFADPVFLQDLQKFSLPGYPSGTYFVFEVEGDSMSPKVLPKDKVITHQVDDIKWLRDGYMHIVVTDGGILLKRPVRKKKDILTLYSDNDLHRPIDVHMREVRQILFCYEKISTDLGRERNLEETVLKTQLRLEQLESLIKNRFPDIPLD
jgi:phage repressor protein C with HTH and peptisase S24 domain